MMTPLEVFLGLQVFLVFSEFLTRCLGDLYKKEMTRLWRVLQAGL